MSSSDLLVICGLRREAALGAGPGIVTLAGGGSRQALERRLASLEPGRLSAVVSFGLAGGLDPALAVGDLVIPRCVTAGADEWPVSAELAESLRDAAAGHGIIVASRGSIAGVDAPLTTPDGKTALRAEAGAVAVDMESHVAAAWAARHGLPFSILRIVSDAAESAVPPAAIAAMRDDGSIDAGAAVRSIMREPTQIPALIRVAWDGARAFRALGRAAACLNSRR